MVGGMSCVCPVVCRLLSQLPPNWNVLPLLTSDTRTRRRERKREEPQPEVPPAPGTCAARALCTQHFTAKLSSRAVQSSAFFWVFFKVLEKWCGAVAVPQAALAVTG